MSDLLKTIYNKQVPSHKQTKFRMKQVKSNRIDSCGDESECDDKRKLLIELTLRKINHKTKIFREIDEEDDDDELILDEEPIYKKHRQAKPSPVSPPEQQDGVLGPDDSASEIEYFSDDDHGIDYEREILKSLNPTSKHDPPVEKLQTLRENFNTIARHNCIKRKKRYSNGYTFGNILKNFRKDSNKFMKCPTSAATHHDAPAVADEDDSEIDWSDVFDDETEVKRGFNELVYYDKFERPIFSNYLDSNICVKSDESIISNIRANKPIFKSSLSKVWENDDEDDAFDAFDNDDDDDGYDDDDEEVEEYEDVDINDYGCEYGNDDDFDDYEDLGQSRQEYEIAQMLAKNHLARQASGETVEPEDEEVVESDSEIMSDIESLEDSLLDFLIDKYISR